MTTATRLLVCSLPLIAALGACRVAVPPPPIRARYTPLEEGRRWTYRIRAGDRTWSVAMRKWAGDVRSRGSESVRYQFVYGRPGSAEDERTKSIYAEPASGVEEFFIDGYWVSLFHEPPVPLLLEARVGARWSWTGKLVIDRDKATTTTQLAVVALETTDVPAGTFEALRVEERSDDGRFAITRWFAADVGMIKLEAESPKHSFLFELTSHQAPQLQTSSR